MTKIYTRTGDSGETMLFGGGRVRKNVIRVEAMGAVDELNAALGVVRMELSRGGRTPLDVDPLVTQMQHRLFDLGAELATPDPAARGTSIVQESNIASLEAAIDHFDSQLEPLREFILPGGAPVAAQLHMARCICRRAERRVVELSGSEPIRGELLRYLNRLSDLLFVLARVVNRANNTADVTWQRDE